MTTHVFGVDPGFAASPTGVALLAQLVARKPVAIVAKCPTDLLSNAWYQRRGFALSATETTRSGRVLNVWVLQCQHQN